MNKRFFTSTLLFLFFLLTQQKIATASSSLGTISTSNFTSQFLKLPEISKTATSSQNIYWNTPAPYHVEISDTGLKGYLWGPLVGYISLSCENTSSCSSAHFKVSNNNGELSGYAWGENTGWISFNCANPETNNCSLNNNAKVIVNDDGELSGYAWSQNFGWIVFDCSSPSSCVTTDWRKPSTRTPVLAPAGGSGGFISPQTLQEPVSDTSSKKIIPSLDDEQKEEQSLKQEKNTPLPPKDSKTQLKTVKNSSEKEVPITCDGVICSGASPFMFPFTTIAPNISQFKKLQTGGAPLSQSPELVVTSSEKRNTELLSVVTKQTTIIGKVSHFFSSLFSRKENPSPIQKAADSSPTKKERTAVSSAVTEWFKSLFHTK